MASDIREIGGLYVMDLSRIQTETVSTALSNIPTPDGKIGRIFNSYAYLV